MEYHEGFPRFNEMNAADDAVSKAAIHWIRELSLVGDAEGMQRLRPKIAHELLEKADEQMNKGWELCAEWMNGRKISEARHLTHCKYAESMGWDTSKPVTVFDRSYLIS